MALSDEQLKFYKKNGYLHLKQVFQKNEIQTVLYDAKKIFHLQFIDKGYTADKDLPENDAAFNEMMYRLFEDDLQAFSNCGKQAQHLISLHRLSLDEKLIEIIREAGLNFPNISTRPVMYFNHPRLAKEKVFYKVDAHQDWRSMQGSLNSCVIWIPLVDINTDLGALEIVPGSHLDGLLTESVQHSFGMVNVSDEMQKKIIPVEVEQGDALLFSAFLIHQSGENIMDSPRWSCHFRYNDLSEHTFIQRKFAHPYIYKPQDTIITEDFPQKEDLKIIFDNE